MDNEDLATMELEDLISLIAELRDHVESERQRADNNYNLFDLKVTEMYNLEEELNQFKRKVTKAQELLEEVL